jgi:PAS domain S-box-containing protein
MFCRVMERATVRSELSALERYESEELELANRLRFVLEQLPITLWSATPDGRITVSEGRGLAALGLHAGELVGRSVFDFVGEDPEAKSELLRVCAGEAVVGARCVKERWHEYQLAPQREPDGRIANVLGVSMDTTEHRQAGQARRESESRLRAILAHAPMILWAVDRAGRLTLSEGKGLSALGLQPGQNLGMKAHEVGIDLPMAWLDAAIEGQSYVGEVALADPPVCYDTRCEPLRDASGAIEGAIAVSVDITARKQAEHERDRLFRAARRALLGERAALRRVTFLAQASRVLACSLDQDTTLLSLAHLIVPDVADGCIVDIVDPLRPRPPVVAYREPEREPELVEIARRVERGPNTISGRLLAGGEPFFEPQLDIASASTQSLGQAVLHLLEGLGVVSILAVAMRARQRVLGVLCWFTVAESGRRLDQDDVELASDLAVHAALAIDNARMYGEQTLAVQRQNEFLSVASHELRTPVTSLQLAVQALVRQSERAGQGTGPSALPAKMLSTAERQSRRLAQLVENLLDVSRITTGQLSMNLDRVDLAEVVRETASSLAVDAAQAACPLELSVEAPVVGTWDRVRLEQVVTNLLSNALKYGSGKPVALSVESDGTVARLRVEDHGIGIPYERQEAIFDRFERAVSARHYGGFGLGLYIVKQIVCALGGTVEVCSAPGGGAVFTVALPLGGPSRASDECRES